MTATLRRDQELIVHAAQLAHTAPQAWSAFVVSVRKFADGEARACVASPPDHLQRLQGRAQQCAEIAALFEDAVKSATRIAQHPAGHSAAVSTRRT